MVTSENECLNVLKLLNTLLVVYMYNVSSIFLFSTNYIIIQCTFVSLCRGCWMSKRLTICLWLGWSFCQPCLMTHLLPRCLRLLSSVYQLIIKSAFTIFPTGVSIFVFYIQSVWDHQFQICTWVKLIEL